SPEPLLLLWRPEKEDEEVGSGTADRRQRLFFAWGHSLELDGGCGRSAHGELRVLAVQPTHRLLQNRRGTAAEEDGPLLALGGRQDREREVHAGDPLGNWCAEQAGEQHQRRSIDDAEGGTIVGGRELGVVLE